MLISTSGLSAFKRCRKSYKFGYVDLLAPKRPAGNAAEQGTHFHAMMERAAKWGDEWVAQALVDEDNPMLDVALTYLQHYPLPDKPVIVDEPQYIAVGDDWLRWTPDLVFWRGDTLVIRDYKTFERKPSIDTELDFQARIYVACAMRKFGTDNVWFEHEYVRRTPPGVSHNARGDVWSPADCYIRIPLVVGRAEADRVWDETLWVLEEIKTTMANGHWYRQERNCCNSLLGSEYACLCKAEMQQGTLDPQTIDMMADKRSELKLPEGLT